MDHYYKNRKRLNAEKKEKRKSDGGAGAAYAREYRRKNHAMTLIGSAKWRAKKKGLAYDLDDHLPELLERMNKKRCEMTGVPLVSYEGGERGHNTMTLDRIDVEKGYTYDNVRVICWAMNCALGTWGEEVLRGIVKRWR
jgi:hypothetical protein